MRFLITDGFRHRRCRQRDGFSRRAAISLAACSWLLGSVRLVFAQASQTAEHAGVRDFIEYWSASRLLASGGNPYSPAELMVLQQSIGWNGASPLIMWNPPWTMLFTLPFGLLNFTAGQFIWLLVHVILILFSVQQLWRIYGDTEQASPFSWVLALTFIPTVFVLIIGQITPLILAGLALLLYSERKQKQWILGASLVILSVKPHLLYLFWIVFALWIWEKRQWRVISAAALFGVAAVLIPLLFNPNIYSQYLALYEVTDVWKPADWPAPTLRNVIKVFLHVDQTWLQLAPTMAAVLWVVYYWLRHKQSWLWLEQLPLIVLVSVTSSFFVWTYDLVVVLPALVEGAIWIRGRPARWHQFWTARLYVAINACHLLLRFWIAEELWYFWLGPALLVNYLIFCWEKAVKRGQPGERAKSIAETS